MRLKWSYTITLYDKEHNALLSLYMNQINSMRIDIVDLIRFIFNAKVERTYSPFTYKFIMKYRDI